MHSRLDAYGSILKHSNTIHLRFLIGHRRFLPDIVAFYQALTLFTRHCRGVLDIYVFVLLDIDTVYWTLMLFTRRLTLFTRRLTLFTDIDAC